MQRLFSFLKGAAIVRWGLLAIRNLWPFLLAFVFWPEIDSMLSGFFPWWGRYISAVSGYVVDASQQLRQVPYLGSVFAFLGDAWDSVRLRLANMLA